MRAAATLGEYGRRRPGHARVFSLLTLGTGIGAASSPRQRRAGDTRWAPASSGTTRFGPIPASSARAARSAASKRRPQDRTDPARLQAGALIPGARHCWTGRASGSARKPIRKAAQAGVPHGVAAFNAFCDDLALGLANVSRSSTRRSSRWRRVSSDRRLPARRVRPAGRSTHDDGSGAARPRSSGRRSATIGRRRRATAHRIVPSGRPERSGRAARNHRRAYFDQRTHAVEQEVAGARDAGRPAR